MDYKEEYKNKLMSLSDAVKKVKSGDRIYVGTASSVAYGLLNSLWERRKELEDVTLMGSNGYQYTPCYYEKEENPFSFSTYFMGINERNAIKAGRKVDYTSLHLSLCDDWVEYVARPNVCFLEVSPMDSEGNFSVGPSNVALYEKLSETKSLKIVQVNKNTPYVLGHGNLININEVDIITECDTEYANYVTTPPDEISEKIASYILEEIPDGATFQLGIGNISTAIGYGLRKKNDLGIHTELLNQPMLELMNSGNVTNTKKGYMNGKTVYSFSFGAPELYKALDNNPKFYGAPFNYANDPRIIMRNKNMMSINATMSFNLLGEACSDCIGWKQQSGTGGQLDFVKGAQWSEGGKSFIATQSYFIKDGVRYSKIVPDFEPGSVVTTPRSEIQYVATEYGCVNLKQLTMRERVGAMIELAHPDFREELRAEAKKHNLL